MISKLVLATLGAAMFLGTAFAEDKPKGDKPLAKCRAIAADKKQIAEAEGDMPASCFSQLYDKVQEALCVAGTKGKKFDYTVQFDHVIKAGKTTIKMDDEKKTHTCRVIGKAK
jgi:hypothetical protein